MADDENQVANSQADQDQPSSSSGAPEEGVKSNVPEDAPKSSAPTEEPAPSSSSGVRHCRSQPRQPTIIHHLLPSLLLIKRPLRKLPSLLLAQWLRAVRAPLAVHHRARQVACSRNATRTKRLLWQTVAWDFWVVAASLTQS